MGSVFVTVGTTSFDDLIETVCSPETLQVLQNRGYQKLVLQVGRGALEPVPGSIQAVAVEVFRFKDSVAEELRRADLVISHAGAGSCLETLEEGKPLIVVINEKLMNNHQLELAKQLHRDGHVLYCNCSTLVETLQSMDLSTLKPFPPGHPEKFALFLDNVFGFYPRAPLATRRATGPRAEPSSVPSARSGSAPVHPGRMQKGWKKYFGQKSFSEVAMDEYLGSLGLYRKMTAKDASCLFRAVSEQLFSSQIHHTEVRKACVLFMRQHQHKFESYVEGSFEKYLERLTDPKESAGQLEMSALSVMYKRDFILYRYPGKPPTYATDNGFQGKILLCCSSNGHYDSVYTKQFQENAAICQAVLYEILYKNVFGMDEEELRSAVEVFRSGSKKNRNSGSVGNEDANFDCLHEKVSQNPSEKRVDDWEGNDTDNPQEDKFKQGTEEEKPPENPSKVPVPYKVLKALDPEIYRNVEFDVWLDSRKELQKTDYMVFAGRQYYLGDKCQVRLEPGGKYYNAHIQEVGQDGSTLTVFVEELAEKHTVPLDNLKPVTQVAPVLAWSMVPSRKGGSYQKITGGYFTAIEMDIKTRKRMFKKVRGKDAMMSLAYSRGQPGLPPRLQQSVPLGHPPPVPCSQGDGNMAPYEPCQPQNPPQRHNRGFGMPRGSARFINRHNLVGSQVAFCPRPGKRCCQSYENFSCRPCSYSRSRRQMQCVNKECQFGFVAGSGEEPQAPEETINFYEVEGEDATAFPALPSQGSLAPNYHAASQFWVARRAPSSVPPNKQTLNSSEEEEETSENGKFHEEYIYASPDPDCETAVVFSSAEPTANLEEGPVPVTPQEGVAAYSYPQKYCHQSYWPPMVFVQPVLPPSPVEVYPAYAEPSPLLDQPLPQLYTDAGRAEVPRVPLEAPANGNFHHAEPPALSYGPVYYYPVVLEPFSQQPLPGFDPLVPAYRCVSAWHPGNPPYGNSPQIANAVSSGPLHQVSYIASPNPAPHDVPQGM
ncbi:UDP-N-acetylglucosamine transferase subunit ALG13 [Heliangelus exortis]|uniref:UDP-N-acetylglucosamine transferase subunit ALG13 n=1 Tax=Heliangelus exortis TaxID=472823 RepID=UPI003A90B04A